MQSDRLEGEELRRRLYRPGVSEADVAAYARTLDAPAPVPAAVAPGPADARASAHPSQRRRRRVVVAIGGLLGVALLGAVVVQGAMSAPPLPSADPTDPAVLFSAPARPALPAVFDRGARPFAGGSSTTSAAYPGQVQYTAADGDTVEGIAARFGLCRMDVEHVMPDDFDWSTLKTGEVFILGRTDDATEARLLRSGGC